MVAALLAIAPAGCAVYGSDDPDLDDSLATGDPGEFAFNKDVFHGNGRTCRTCHPSAAGESGTLNPAQVQALFARNPKDPLFLHDGADTLGGKTFNRIKAHATILIDMPLPANVRILGSSARHVILPRGIPTTMNTPAMDPVLMYDAREPNLQQQARNAIIGHAQSTDIRADKLDAIAAFQMTLFNRANVRAFATSGTPLVMPAGNTDAEKRGRRWFIVDSESDPNMVGEAGIDPTTGGFQFCGFCHGGDNLDETSDFFGLPFIEPNIPGGSRMADVLVAEFNDIGNPVYDFEFTRPDGSVVVHHTPDAGRALITGNPDDFGFPGVNHARPATFKIPSLWGIKDTAPYFHDNSSNDLTALVRHYQRAAPILSGGLINLTDGDVADIVAYLQLL